MFGPVHRNNVQVRYDARRVLRILRQLVRETHQRIRRKQRLVSVSTVGDNGSVLAWTAKVVLKTNLDVRATNNDLKSALKRRRARLELLSHTKIGCDDHSPQPNFKL